MITLAALPRTATDAVLHLDLGPGQDSYVRPIGEMVTEGRPSVDFHLIRWQVEAVGFFKIDCDYGLDVDFAKPGSHGLRGLLIGAQYQRRGLGRAALAALPGYLAGAYPQMRQVQLTVNCSNPAAYHLYLATGWRDAGGLYLGGNSGPQHVLTLVPGAE